ncbi:MAG: HIRAN domain-containing protein [Oscillospiraceae bacterium]|nr:HIRAN domain-containing protein [Oscillospiraceae bacterium]
MGFFDIFKSKPTGIPPERMPDHEIKPVTEPIKGYTLKYHYHDVEISSWEMIPRDVKIGNRIIFLQEPTNEADPNAVLLMFVPQKKKLGYLFRGEMQNMVNDYLKRGDKVVGRLSYLAFKPCKTVKIDIAFFKKDKKKK